MLLLLENKKIVDQLFLTFVDYSAINGYYGDIYTIVKKNVESMDYFQIKKDQLHPILIGRLASIEIVSKQLRKESYDSVLVDLENRILALKNNVLDLTYELITISLV